MQKLDIKVPVVVRLAGTNVELGRKILADSGVKLITADTLAEAAEKAVAAAQFHQAASADVRRDRNEHFPG